MRILVLTDNFLVGGRETYLKCYIESLRKRLDIEVGLFTGKIDYEFLDDTFQTVFEVAGGEPELKQWLTKGKEVITQFCPDVIWVQHYTLLPAWLLSVNYDIPLLCTFHGPLFNEGRLTSDEDRLGLACSIKYGAKLSCVSEEIRTQILNLSAGRHLNVDVPLLVNAVEVPQRRAAIQRESVIFPNVLVVSRKQKLEHLRASVLLFSKLKREFSKAKLTIHTGFLLPDGKQKRNDLSISTLLGRKWIAKNFRTLLVLSHISVKPLRKNVDKATSKYDLVFGMGRVALESIASKVPVVLVGYQRPLALLMPDNFIEFQRSNFSGRGVSEHSLPKIVKDIKLILSENNTDMTHLVNVENQVDKLATTLIEITKKKLDHSDEISPDLRGGITSLFNDVELTDSKVNLTLVELERCVTDTLKNINNEMDRENDD